MSAAPNPGSQAALNRGCKCPVIDNHYGHAKPWGEFGWWINADCPLHGRPSEQSHDRP